MDQVCGPRQYVLNNLRQLHDLWPGICNGAVETVHQARVTTRRLRAALPVVSSARPEIVKEIRRIGRMLGRVRELDVTQALLASIESRVPGVESAAAVVRRDLGRRQDRERRRMVKALEAVSLRGIGRSINAAKGRAMVHFLWRDWRRELRAEIGRRAQDVHVAVDRTTAVYMPKRSHAARIAVKKLRYVLEVALATGVVAADAMLDEMKKAQDALGELHDLQVLGRTIDRCDFSPHAATAEASVLSATVAFESSRLHEKYLRRRESLRAVCDACREISMSRSVGDVARSTARTLPVVGLMAIPVAYWYLWNETDESLPRSVERPSPVPASV